MVRQFSKTAGVVAVLSVAAVISACSDQSITGSEPSSLRPSLAIGTVQSAPICSDATVGMLSNVNPGWVAPVAGSSWVSKSATGGTIGRPRLGMDTYTSTFTAPPAGATNIQVSGYVLADNDVVITAGGAPIYNSFTSVNGPRSQATYPIGVEDVRTQPSFKTVGGIAFSGAVTGNTVSFAVYNDDDPNTTYTAQPSTTNPSGLSFCYTVSYDPPVTNQYWCSPGYWKNAKDAAWLNVGGLSVRNTLYNAIPLTPTVAGNPTIWTVLNNPSTYKGPAINAVANYLAGLAGWSGTQATGDFCPLNNAGALTR